MDVNQEGIRQLAGWAFSTQATMPPWLQQMFSLATEHGELIIALATFSFGIWKWYRFNEHFLHYRLLDYIEESDRNLNTATRSLIRAYNRNSGKKLSFKPKFVPDSLNSIFADLPRGPLVHSTRGALSLDHRLEKAVEQTSERRAAAYATLESLDLQERTARLARGTAAAR
ncbi:MAG: hypothetical protein AAFY15_13880, partial [Cyanobacteria bacterium J06648_11]